MDWTDPNIWKLPAALIDYWKTIAVEVVALAGALGAILRWGFAPIRWGALKIKGWTIGQPDSRPLRFVQDDRQSRWSVARLGDKVGTHVHGHWYVTNTSDRNVLILKVRLRKHLTNFVNVFTQHPERNVFGYQVPIPAHRMAEVTTDLTFFPPIGRDHEPLVTDVIFTDNFGEEHRVRRVRFSYIGPDKPI